MIRIICYSHWFNFKSESKREPNGSSIRWRFPPVIFVEIEFSKPLSWPTPCTNWALSYTLEAKCNNDHGGWSGDLRTSELLETFLQRQNVMKEGDLWDVLNEGQSTEVYSFHGTTVEAWTDGFEKWQYGFNLTLSIQTVSQLLLSIRRIHSVTAYILWRLSFGSIKIWSAFRDYLLLRLL